MLITSRVPPAFDFGSSVVTGVAKSATLNALRRFSGRLALPISTTMREPSLRMSVAAPSPSKRMITRPEPLSPRRKSMLATLRLLAMRLAGSALLAMAVPALEVGLPASTVRTSRLPALRVV